MGALAKATTITYGMGADGITLGSSTPNCQLYINPTTFVNPPTGDYPVVGLTYLMFYGQNNGKRHGGDEGKMVNYIGSNNYKNILAPLEYTPIPAATVTNVRKALKGSGSVKPCLNA